MVIAFALILLRGQSRHDLIDRFSEVRRFTHTFQLAKAVQDLSLDLTPLGAVIEEEKLNLANDLILTLSNLVLLHLERAFDVPQQ